MIPWGRVLRPGFKVKSSSHSSLKINSIKVLSIHPYFYCLRRISTMRAPSAGYSSAPFSLPPLLSIFQTPRLAPSWAHLLWRAVGLSPWKQAQLPPPNPIQACIWNERPPLLSLLCQAGILRPSTVTERQGLRHLAVTGSWVYYAEDMEVVGGQRWWKLTTVSAFDTIISRLVLWCHMPFIFFMLLWGL